MRLDGETANKIKTGAKTQLRRPGSLWSPFKQLEQPVVVERPRGDDDPPPKHADDTTVLRSECKIIITSQVQSTLGAMTEADAQVEGFKRGGRTALAQFREWWEGYYEETWSDSRAVWVVSFEVHTHDERPIYVARGGGYTHDKSRAVDELPAVLPQEVDEINARRAKGLSRDQVEAARKQKARSVASKVRELDGWARGRGIDMDREFETLERYLASVRRRHEEADAA